MYPPSPCKASEKIRAHKIGKSSNSGTFWFKIHSFLKFFKPKYIFLSDYIVFVIKPAPYSNDFADRNFMHAEVSCKIVEFFKVIDVIRRAYHKHISKYPGSDRIPYAQQCIAVRASSPPSVIMFRFERAIKADS